MSRFFGLLAFAVVLSAAFTVAIISSGHDASAERSPSTSANQEPRTVQQPTAVSPVAVELFTSQGCSSCPPADRLIASLVDDPDLVIITRPVTYWDRLGWRDTLGREENTTLQRAYARTLESGGGRSYTPQAVVDGRVGLVGSRRSELRQAITNAKEAANAIMIESEGMADGGRVIRVSGNTGQPLQVRLLALDSSETVNIGRGENTGRSVTYTNVLRAEQTLGQWNGGEESFAIAETDLNTPETDRHAIVVRDGDAGPILAVRYL